MSSVQAIRSLLTDAGASLGQTGVGRRSVNMFLWTYAVSPRLNLSTTPPIQPSDHMEPLAPLSSLLGHLTMTSTILATTSSGRGLSAYREMSPHECVSGSGCEAKPM